MFHFPKRPGPRYDYLRRRQWNSEVPCYEDLVAWYRAEDCCWLDAKDGTLCSPGENIAVVSDLSQYGRDAVKYATGSPTFVIDSGFPAMQIPIQNGSMASTLITTASMTVAMTITVFRSLSTTWANYGAVFCAAGRQYLFGPIGGTGGFLFALFAIQRKNGTAMTPGDTLSPITSPMVFTAGLSAASTGRGGIGSDLYNIAGGAAESTAMCIYEILAFGSLLTTDQIVEIEAYLKDKYAIA
jgi:hypothetical protein